MLNMDGIDPGLLFGILVALGVLAIGGGIWAVHRRLERKRTEAMRRHAALMGGSFLEVLGAPDGPESLRSAPDLVPLIRSLEFFRKGRSRRIANLIARPEENRRREWIFDYSFVTGAGKSQRTVRQTIWACRFSGRALPVFSLAPEGILAKLFDGRDIDFEEDPEFSKRFLLKGPAPEPVRKLFNPQLRSLVLGERKLTIESSGESLILMQRERRIPAEEIPRFLSEAQRILGALDAEH